MFDGDGAEAVDGLPDAPLDGLGDFPEGDALHTCVLYQERTLLAGKDPEAERGRQAPLRCIVPPQAEIFS